MENLDLVNGPVRKKNSRGSMKSRKTGRLKEADQALQGRRRFSITLSRKAGEAFDWLKETTDADTDSEVIRNALRLHYELLQRASQGVSFFVGSHDGAGSLTQVELFVANAK